MKLVEVQLCFGTCWAIHNESGLRLWDDIIHCGFSSHIRLEYFVERVNEGYARNNKLECSASDYSKHILSVRDICDVTLPLDLDYIKEHCPEEFRMMFDINNCRVLCEDFDDLCRACALFGIKYEEYFSWYGVKYGFPTEVYTHTKFGGAVFHGSGNEHKELVHTEVIKMKDLYKEKVELFI